MTEHLDLVGPAELAVRLGIPKNTVLGWKHRGLLPEPWCVLSGVPGWIWTEIEPVVTALANRKKQPQ